MARGGYRAGAGRPKGRKDTKTLEREIVRRAMEQRILKALTPVLTAKIQSALGQRVMFVNRGGRWTRVTNAKTIETLLNSPSTENGKEYWYITAQDPDERANENLLNRVFGTPKQTLEVEGKPWPMYAFAAGALPAMSPESE